MSRVSGRVKWFNDAKDYEFIEPLQAANVVRR